ncbi:type 1 glutamine amidotransferase [Lactobacillus sp.]|uniref:type 1 glutamine amidotransferase n=1 Tax=Lactobacillus sp. TaxID=1591 RepID=UPI003EF371AE
MRVNILQHTPNEGPGAIKSWIKERGHKFYIYHPENFGILPKASETDLLVILGGPMSPGDDLPWLPEERKLIAECLKSHIPILGICLGAQQIAMTLGSSVHQAAHKEVGWAPVYRQSDALPGLPEKLLALHWHQDMFEMPEGSTLLYSSDLLDNQGFLVNGNVVGLQFHLEPEDDNVREIVINDGAYAEEGNDLHQSPAEIMERPVPAANKQAIYTILDYLSVH